MAQLGRFDNTFLTPLGLPAVGASCAVYREGATVNGNQSGTTPLTITVRHRGKIAAGDSVFIGTATGTTYSVDSVTATTVTVSGFVDTLAVSGGDRLTPSNSQPTLYSDDQGGATTGNPLTTSSLGRAQCWMNTGAYDFIVSGGGSTTTAFVGEVTVGESPATVISGETDSATAVAHIEDTYFQLATAGAKLKSWRNAGTEKASVDKDGTGIFPRIGQSSSVTTGGAFRFVDGNVFPLTVAGVQAALDECESAGGGTVYVPSNANISISTTPIKIPNRCGIVGTGLSAPGNPTFKATSSTVSTSVVENKTQDGTQQIAFLRNVQLSADGKTGTASLTNGVLWFKRVLSGSHIQDVRVVDTPSVGVLFEGTTTAAQGIMYCENLVVGNCGDNNIVVKEGARNVIFNHVESDNPGTGKANLRIQATTSSSAQSIGVKISGLYMENDDTTGNLVVVDSCANVQIDGLTSAATAGTPPTTPIKIQGLGNSGGGTSGFVLRSAYIHQTGVNAVLIDDQTAGIQVTVGPNSSQPLRFVSWYSSPVAISTGGIQSQNQIIGIQYQKQGVDVASSATITPLEGNFFSVTGTADITSITATGRDKGRIITLKFNSTAATNGVVDGSNLKLAGNLAYTADDTLTLVCDGTNWYEIARSVN